MRSNYTELRTWHPATASFTGQVQVRESARACYFSVWTTRLKICVNANGRQSARVRVSAGVNVRTSALTASNGELSRGRRAKKARELSSGGLDKGVEELNLTWQEPGNVRCQRPDHSQVLPPSPAWVRAMKGLYAERRSFCTKAQGGGYNIIEGEMGYQKLSWSDGLLNHTNIWGSSDFCCKSSYSCVNVLYSGTEKYLDASQTRTVRNVIALKNLTKWNWSKTAQKHVTPNITQNLTKKIHSSVS